VSDFQIRGSISIPVIQKALYGLLGMVLLL
jgi:hypothetical protein